MLDELIQLHGDKLYALCLKLCNYNEHDAKDLYQETWLRAYKSFSQYDTTKNFSPWISRICTNLYRDIYRRKKIVSFISFKTEEEQDLAINSIPEPQQDDSYQDIQQAIDTLPIKFKTCILLYYFNGASIEETALALNIPVGTVKSRLSKARKLLEKELTKYES